MPLLAQIAGFCAAFAFLSESQASARLFACCCACVAGQRALAFTQILAHVFHCHHFSFRQDFTGQEEQLVRDELPRTHTEDLVFYYDKRLVRLFSGNFFSNFPFAFVTVFRIVLALI